MFGFNRRFLGGVWPAGATPPAALEWPSQYAFDTRWSAEKWTAFARLQVSTPFLAPGAAEYWVRPTGNNANSGLSPSAAKRSIHAAVTAGNATGAPYRVNVEAGDYNRTNGITSSSTTVRPTQDVAIIGYGGTPVLGSWDDLTWSNDGSGTNTYSASVNNAARVLDRLHTNAAGSLVDLSLVADPATVRTTLGGYVVSGNVIYVRRADLAAVTNTNTRVLRNSEICELNSVSKNVYLENLELVGGAGGCVKATATLSRNVVAVDCVMGYSGSPATPADAFRIDQMTGLAMALRCTFRAASKDGANGHQTVAGQTWMLLVDCIGFDNGRFASTSNNGLTLHENVRGADIRGQYTRNYGVNVHIIDDSRLWCYRTASGDSHGDIVLGGAFAPADYRTEGTSLMWLQGTTASGSATSIAATMNSVVTKIGHASSGVEVTSGSAVITGS